MTKEKFLEQLTNRLSAIDSNNGDIYYLYDRDDNTTYDAKTFITGKATANIRTIVAEMGNLIKNYQELGCSNDLCNTESQTGQTTVGNE